MFCIGETIIYRCYRCAIGSRAHEYERLRAALEQAHRDGAVPEIPTARVALDDLLIRVRHTAGA